MKKFFALLIVAASSALVLKAGVPVTFAQLPAAAQSFISMNFPDEKISYTTKDDDFVFPDYTVVFVSGMKIEFRHNGTMNQIESRNGVPADLMPYQIVDYVKANYPGTVITQYEIGRRTYEIKLSNRLEMKFNRNYDLIEIDD